MTTTSDLSLGENNYLIDAQNVTEMARLLNQDMLLTKAMGGIFPENSDLSTVDDILDIACGPGGWVLEVARLYPNIHVMGIDLSKDMVDYARAHAKARHLFNASFKVMDALHPFAFEDDSFDLVNGRTLVGFMTPITWPALIKESFRILRGGGILRLTEGEMPITNSLAFETLSSWLLQAFYITKRSFSPNGHHLGNCIMLRCLLQSAGFQNVKIRPYVIDHSAGSAVYEGWYQDYMIAYQLVQPFLLKLQITTQNEFEQTYQQMLVEMRSQDFCALTYSLTVWGEKL